MTIGYQGSPFQAYVHSSDASGGIEVPIYRSGDANAHTLASDEYVEVHSVEFVSAAGGDCYANVGSSAGTTASEIIFRGSFAANGGIANGRVEPPFAEAGLGHKIWLTAPAGVVDLVVRGTIRKGSVGTRPSWKA